jgi:all-trans-retinol 13,14-reductase
METEKTFDAIVIGSGIGGLAAASVLARLKHYRVLVLEQHFKLGGFTQTFQRPGGYRWDIGLHYVGEMGTDSPFRKSMDFITGSQVEWLKMKDPFETFMYPGLTFEVPSDPEAYFIKLNNYFPSESGSLRRYFRDLNLMMGLSGQGMSSPRFWRHKVFFQWICEWARQTFRSYLDFRFKDFRLKALLASQWGNYGLPPASVSFGVHADIARHYLGGGYYPVGSASILAEAIGKVILNAGGVLKVRHQVKHILVENGKAVGVEVESRQGREVLNAPEIYSDAGAEITYGKLLPADLVDQGEIKELESVTPFGVVNLYLGLKSRCEHLGIHGQNFWIFDSFNHDDIWERRNQLMEGRASACYVNFPGLKDPMAVKPTAEIMAPIDFNKFSVWKNSQWRRRGPEYEVVKKKITQTLLDFVENHIPGFRKEISYAELSTPLTVERFSGHRKGGIFGYPSTPRRYDIKSLGPKTPVKGLFLVGVDAYGTGIVGSMIGGIAGVAARHGFSIFPQVFKGN